MRRVHPPLGILPAGSLMTDCQHCGRDRDDHVGLRETCPDLPAQTFEAKRPTHTWFCGCEYDYLSGKTVPLCNTHKKANS
jgi:hypothetical protein